MDTNHSDYQRGLRGQLGPAWRWEQAKKLPPLKTHRLIQNSDPIVRDTRDFLTLVDRGPHGVDRARELYPSIAAAVDLNNDSARIASLKIMVVAGCSSAEIQARLKFPPDVVAMWENLFFDVRDTGGAMGWLSTQVIEAERRVGHGRLAAQLKLAIVGGVEAAIAILDADDRARVDEGQRLFDRHLKLHVKFDQALEMPVSSSQESLRFVALYTNLHSQERRLEVDRQKLEEQCREAARRHKVAMYRLELAAERQEEKATRRARKEEARAQERAAWQAHREWTLKTKIERRAEDHRSAEARAADSPLSQLKWAKPPESHAAVDESAAAPDSLTLVMLATAMSFLATDKIGIGVSSSENVTSSNCPPCTVTPAYPTDVPTVHSMEA